MAGRGKQLQVLTITIMMIIDDSDHQTDVSFS
jgi:hypothetical protein